MADPTASTVASAADRILGHFSLPVQQPAFEKMLNLCRILLGLGMLHRYIDILGFAVIANDPLGATDDARYAATFCVALCLGFATPLALLGMMFFTFYTPFGFTIGHQMVLLACWVLLFGGAGRRISIDAWLLERPAVGRVISALYSLAVPFSPSMFAGLRFMVLLLYASISFCALAYHFDDPLWLSGNVLQVLSTMSYMTDHAATAAAFRDALPGVYDVLCSIGLFLQCALELLMLPLCFFRWGRAFVALQWLGFILLRAVQMNLGYLCFTELLLWLLVFGYRPIGNVLRGRTMAPLSATAGHFRDSRPGRLLGAFLITASATVLYFNVVNTATINAPGSALSRLPHMPLTFRLFVQWPVNVFNEDDLAMGSGQLVLCETDAAGGILRTVPYLDHHGGRLSYMRNDLMYFGHSVPWQRSPREKQARTAPALAMRIALLDARLHPRADRHYLALFFAQSQEPFDGYAKWGAPVLQGGFALDVPLAFRARVDALLPSPSFDLPPGHVGQQRRMAETTAVLRGLQADGMLSGLARLPALKPPAH